MKKTDDQFVQLMKALNKLGDYDRCINDFESDMYAGETILGMQKSKQGEERLRVLARELEILFRPFVTMAEQIIQQQETERNLRESPNSESDLKRGDKP
eukprot:767996-Hanusia_phi.AAC.8